MQSCKKFPMDLIIGLISDGQGRPNIIGPFPDFIIGYGAVSRIIHLSSYPSYHNVVYVLGMQYDVLFIYDLG